MHAGAHLLCIAMCFGFQQLRVEVVRLGTWPLGLGGLKAGRRKEGRKEGRMESKGGSGVRVVEQFFWVLLVVVTARFFNSVGTWAGGRREDEREGEIYRECLGLPLPSWLASGTAGNLRRERHQSMASQQPLPPPLSSLRFFV